MNKSIAVLLTVYNRKDCTLRCLQQLKEQLLPEGVTCSVYITDGGSNDSTVETVQKMFPEVNIQVKNGVFWNRGMYASWEWASKEGYDYYMWLNDDTFIYNDCVMKLYNASAEKDDKAIIVGATVDTTTRKHVTYGGRTDKEFAPINGSLTEINHFNGNIVLIPAEVYATLGNLDYYYTHSKGDFDYGIRARKAKIQMYQVGKPLGECDSHPHIDKWCDPEVPFKKRWQLMHRPNGMPPKETFHLEKQESILKASIHYLTIIIRCAFPSIWIKTGKATIKK